MAARLGLRAYQNEVVIIVKATAAVSAVTLTDLMAAANEIVYLTYDPFTPLLTAAALYWVLINLVRAGFARADARLNVHLAPAGAVTRPAFRTTRAGTWLATLQHSLRRQTTGT